MSRELDAEIAEKVMGWELSDRGFYVKGDGRQEAVIPPVSGARYVLSSAMFA